MLGGRLRLVVGERDLTLAPGEAAEFDTSLPHWLGTADGGAVELLVLFGLQGCARTYVPAERRFRKRIGRQGAQTAIGVRTSVQHSCVIPLEASIFRLTHQSRPGLT